MLANPSLAHLGVAALLACAISLTAYWRDALSGSGAVAGAGVGTLIFGFGGWPYGVLLIMFFASSTALGRIPDRAHRRDEAQTRAAKGNRRDAVQVLANGGLAAVLAAASSLAPGILPWWPAFIGTIAAVTADTWASELGAHSHHPPRSILTGQPMAKGLSGGVTTLGTAASAAGGGAIGYAAGLMTGTLAELIALGTVAGLIGSLADSILGATAQQLRQCRSCATLTEALNHCAQPTARIRGLAFIDNDAVNLATSAIGAAIGLAAWTVLG